MLIRTLEEIYSIFEKTITEKSRLYCVSPREMLWKRWRYVEEDATAEHVRSLLTGQRNGNQRENLSGWDSREKIVA